MVTVVSCRTCIFGTCLLSRGLKGLRYFARPARSGEEMWVTGPHSRNSMPSRIDCFRPTLLPRCTVPSPLNRRATMSSSTDLKSSKKIVSDAHLKTRANLQYGLIPEAAVTRKALTITSVRRKAIEVNMHTIITPKRVLILINVHNLKPYVFPIASISFHVVKIHQGSRTRASHGRIRILTSDPRLLKYSKFDHASAIQNG